MPEAVVQMLLELWQLEALSTALGSPFHAHHSLVKSLFLISSLNLGSSSLFRGTAHCLPGWELHLFLGIFLGRESRRNTTFQEQWEDKYMFKIGTNENMSLAWHANCELTHSRMLKKKCHFPSYQWKVSKVLWNPKFRYNKHKITELAHWLKWIYQNLFNSFALQ